MIALRKDCSENFLDLILNDKPQSRDLTFVVEEGVEESLPLNLFLAISPLLQQIFRTHPLCSGDALTVIIPDVSLETIQIFSRLLKHVTFIGFQR